MAHRRAYRGAEEGSTGMSREQHGHPEGPAIPSSRPSASFGCESSAEGVGAAWVRVSGELDADVAPRLEQAMRDAQACARLVVVDLRELASIDAAGVRVIVDASVRAMVLARRLVVACAPPHIVSAFAPDGIAEVVEMFDLDQADSPVDARLHLVVP